MTWGICKECQQPVRLRVPAGGDGSALQPHRHGSCLGWLRCIGGEDGIYETKAEAAASVKGAPENE